MNLLIFPWPIPKPFPYSAEAPRYENHEQQEPRNWKVKVEAPGMVGHFGLRVIPTWRRPGPCQLNCWVTSALITGYWIYRVEERTGTDPMASIRNDSQMQTQLGSESTGLIANPLTPSPGCARTNLLGLTSPSRPDPAHWHPGICPCPHG